MHSVSYLADSYFFYRILKDNLSRIRDKFLLAILDLNIDLNSKTHFAIIFNKEF